jgi:hypothetical protein
MFIVVGYYTLNSLYEKEASRLISSLIMHNVPYHITPVESKGNWYANTQFKPTFLRNMMLKFPDYSIVYVDVDAEFFSYPDLFNDLDENVEVDVAVHLLDHAKRGRNIDYEMLSGTIFLKNNPTVRGIVDNWIEGCKDSPTLWDQAALAEALKGQPFYTLPEEYCTIYDYMSDVANPVIKHYQASRRARHISRPNNVEFQHPIIARRPGRGNEPRKIGRGGLTRYRRNYRNIV